MSNDLLQIDVLIEVRRCGSCFVLHIKHPSIPKPVWHKLTEPMYCPFPSTFRRCIFVRQVELAPGRFVLPSGHARSQPARAFPAQTVKTGWTLLSTGSVVVLVLQALIHNRRPCSLSLSLPLSLSLSPPFSLSMSLCGCKTSVTWCLF